MTSDKLIAIANKFCIEGNIESIETLGGCAFINDTYFVKTLGDSPNYILQRKNHNIFTNIPAMMTNIEEVTTHIKQKVLAEGGNHMREALTVIKTTDGLLYHKDEQDNFWAVCLFIDGSVTYERADSPQLAYKGGVGIGKFQSQLSDFNKPLSETIKGFHNIRWRFQQWDEALMRNQADRKAKVSQQIEWIESRREKMMNFWSLVESGQIPTRVTHNDTKISNILFDANGNVLCVIDLDTVMSSTSLNDFGDAIRSYTNTGVEDDRNLDNVSMSIDMFKAYTCGYLSQRQETLLPLELDYLAFSAQYITFEQVLRFLMDYIDGDSYYKTHYPEHNLTRTLAQYKLLQSIESQHSIMCDIISENLKVSQ